MTRRDRARDRRGLGANAIMRLARHSRLKLHVTPTSATWRNLVERVFAEITRKRIRRRTFKCFADLEQAIEDDLLCRNANPKPVVWTKPAKVIQEKERRALHLLERINGGHQASEPGR